MTSLASSDAAGVVLFAAVAIFGVTIAIWISNAKLKAMMATLHRVADRVGGSVLEGGFFSEPGIVFHVEGRNASLEFYAGNKNSPATTSIAVDMTGISPGRLHILEEGFGQTFLKLFGAQDLTIGDPAFDAHYVVKATPPSVASLVFSRERQREVIGTIRRIQNYRQPTIDLDRHQLVVKIRQYLRDEVQLMALVDTAREFTAYVLQPPRAAGVVIEEVRVAAGGECPVCGTSMNGRILNCEACRTPHHSECWEYMGRCSTYACKGKRCFP